MFLKSTILSCLILLSVSSKLLDHYSRNLLSVTNTLTDSEKKSLLSKHNELRQKVASGNASPQPRGNNINYLFYDDALALVAKNYLDKKCNELTQKINATTFTSLMPHNNARTSELKAIQNQASFVLNDGLSVGENLWWSSVTENDVTKAVDSWYNEINDYTWGQGCVANKVCGHYTQVINAKTRYVGCAKYSGGNCGNVVLCNYYPAQILGSEIYGSDINYLSDCSQCEIDRKCENSLCGGCQNKNWFNDLSKPSNTEDWNCKDMTSADPNVIPNTLTIVGATPSPTAKPTESGKNSICFESINEPQYGQGTWEYIGPYGAYNRDLYQKGDKVIARTSNGWILRKTTLIAGYGTCSTTNLFTCQWKRGTTILDWKVTENACPTTTLAPVPVGGSGQTFCVEAVTTIAQSATAYKYIGTYIESGEKVDGKPVFLKQGTTGIALKWGFGAYWVFYDGTMSQGWLDNTFLDASNLVGKEGGVFGDRLKIVTCSTNGASVPIAVGINDHDNTVNVKEPYLNIFTNPYFSMMLLGLVLILIGYVIGAQQNKFRGGCCLMEKSKYKAISNLESSTSNDDTSSADEITNFNQ